ncbi:hypothetical protein vseg_000352 [Gypsophila vaccaria]
MIMVTVISSVLTETNGVHNQQRRSRAREVSSRYMSPSSSSSSTSSSSRTSFSGSGSGGGGSNSNGGVVRSKSAPRRSLSVDRRQPVSSKLAIVGEVGAVSRLLVASTRSLSVSFQGGAFLLPVSKAKDVSHGGGGGGKATLERRRSIPLRRNMDGGGGVGNAACEIWGSTPLRGRVDGGGGEVRNATPERRRGTPLRGKVDGGGGGNKVERLGSNSKVGDHARWPARSRERNMISRSLECFNDESEGCIGSRFVARALNGSLLDESTRVSFDGVLNVDSRNGDILNEVRGAMDAHSVNGSSVRSDLTASDSESFSSGSSGAREVNGGSHGRGGPHGVVASAQFWQETNMRLRRLHNPGLGLSSSPSSKFVSPPKLSRPRKSTDGPLTFPKTMSSPIREAIRGGLPSKLISPLASSPLRGLSPSRVRNSIGGLMCCSPWETPSVLSFVVDVRRGNVGENRIFAAHQLRLLYNRHLQWRFVTARAEAALSVQRRNAERNLWNAWITITGRRESVRNKRIQLQLLRQKLKLSSILRKQIPYLEEWSLLDECHSCSMQGAIESLKASTLRLPVVGVTADVENVKEAICSAVDVMESIASSMWFLLAKAEEVNSLTTELSKVAAKERNLMEKCLEVLSILTAMQVKDCSLRTHILQLNRLPLS